MLFEEVVFDEVGNFIIGMFVDYILLSVVDLLLFVIDCMVSMLITNLFGVKGVGEVGTIVFTPVVINAVVDALRFFGVNDIRMPVTFERVWRAIAEGANR